MRLRQLIALAGLVLATGLSSPTAAQETQAPQLHAATGLAFPSNIADAHLVRWNDYGQSAQQPALGFSYQYQIAGRLVATVYVYDANQRVPPGADNAVVAAQFAQATGDIERVAQQTGRYRDLRLVSGPTNCTYGLITFRCATYTAIATAQNRQIFTALLVSGYRAHFLKLRLDWPQEGGMVAADVDRFLQTLVGAIVH
ncbi:MAG TPA: hypothetical protein VJ890_26090 [Vineibacter sp.]|nr:hypothetical protein [Vineibacter sp.]